MDIKRLRSLLDPYNPWWMPGSKWEEDLPDYRRPVVADVLADLRDLPQVVSITGPRRVGKSTAVKQVIHHLLKSVHIDPQRILYFSFDDPEVFASSEAQRAIFDLLVAHHSAKARTSYFFLDEIQRLPKWELFIKKYYDLKHPIRFVVSGSASSPIFRSSQESLLGRIKDRHLLPFSFREYCQYQLRGGPEFAQAVESERGLKAALLDGDGMRALQCANRLQEKLRPFEAAVDDALNRYCCEGGFPEVWNLPDPVRKIEYLMEQQVRKVLYEDLMALTQYRKPENVLRFFVYLLARPGAEINTTTVAKEAGVERRVVEENLPRLEMTDLIMRIRKFSHQPLRVRQGSIKCYPVDMALRNAVLKTWTPPDSKTMGLYAENLVMRELVSWPEKIEVSYFREKNREIDFIVTHGGNRHLPIEVKHKVKAEHLLALKRFLDRYRLNLGVVITRHEPAAFHERVLQLPFNCLLLAS